MILDRYIEIWNLVFMQYNRDARVSSSLARALRRHGNGAGAHCGRLQDVHSNYDIDLFKACNCRSGSESEVNDLISRQIAAGDCRSPAVLRIFSRRRGVAEQ